MSYQPAPLGTLLTSAWEEYKNRALPILAFILISTGILGSLAVILALFAGFGGVLAAHPQIYRGWAILLISLSGVLLLGTAITALWCHTALLAIVMDANPGVLAACRRGWMYLWPMTWVITIFSGIVLTGFILGVLPAVLAAVWFSFGMYILLEEDKRGMDAILASMEYVRGDWWNTFGKLLAVWLPYTLISLVPFVGTLVSIFFYPFLMLFMVAVFHDLKSGKGEVELRVSPGARLLWWVIAVIGLLAPLIALSGALLTLMSGESFWFEHTGSSLQGLQS